VSNEARTIAETIRGVKGVGRRIVFAAEKSALVGR
jgi:hypothetical protein